MSKANETNEMHEAQLIERFTAALRRDLNAPAPAGIDLQTVEAIRALVASESAVPLESALAARMWQRALAQAEPEYELFTAQTRSKTDAGISQNLRVLKRHEDFSPAQADDIAARESWLSTTPTAPATRPPNSRHVLQYTLTIAAAVLIVALVGGILIDMVNDPNRGYPSASSLLTETPTAAPTPVCVDGTDYWRAGEASIGAGDYDAALAAYTCAATLDPTNYDAVLLRGGLAAANGDYDQLGYDYYAFITHNQGVAKIDQATVVSVIPTVRAALEARPDDPVLYLLRALVLSSILLDQPADMARLRQIAPDNPVGYLFDRNWPYHYDVDDPNILKAIELAPDSALLDFWLSRGLSEQNAAFAKPFFDRAIQSNPQHPFAYQARAIAEIYLGDMTAAANDFYQHIQHNPGNVDEIGFGEIKVRSGNTYALTMAVGNVSRLTFAAEAGQTLFLDIAQNDGRFIPALVVLDPEGKVMPLHYKIAEPSGEGLSFWGLKIAETGTYTLLMKSNSDTKMYTTLSVE